MYLTKFMQPKPQNSESAVYNQSIGLLKPKLLYFRQRFIPYSVLVNKAYELENIHFNDLQASVTLSKLP